MDTLDVAEPQIIVEYPDDPSGCYWHHRILVEKLSPGVWLAITPDGELQQHDLNEESYKVLERNSMYPAAQRPYVYGCRPLPRAQFLALKRRATIQAQVVGADAEDEATTEHWVVAEVGHPKFGEVVPESELDDSVLGRTKGAAELDGTEVFIELVGVGQAPSAAGAAAESSEELRLLGLHRSGDSTRHLALRDAVPLLRESAFDDWRLPGPRAAREWISAVRDGPGDLTMYDAEWVRRSGVAESSAVAHIHFVLCEVLRVAVTYDQLDISNLMSFEIVVRRIIQDETAVGRNPRHPDYGGLGVAMQAPISERGAATAAGFKAWITDRLREQANIYKQTRLWNEETRHVYNEDEGGGKGRGRGRGAAKKSKARGGAPAGSDQG